jgi:hypothetical protein
VVAELVPTPPPLVACLDALDEVLDDMATDAYAGLDPATQRGAVERLRRLRARLTAHEMAAVRALDAALGNKARTGEMLARTFGRDQHEANRTVRVAKTLSAAPLTEDALASGELAETQAAVIAGAMAGLPESVTPTQREACETTLIADAKRFPIKDLRQRVLRISDVFKEPAEAKRDEDESLRLREGAPGHAPRCGWWITRTAPGASVAGFPHCRPRCSRRRSTRPLRPVVAT